MTLTGLMLAQLGVVLFFAPRRDAARVAACQALRCGLWIASWYGCVLLSVSLLAHLEIAPGDNIQIALNLVPPLLTWMLVSLVLRWLGLLPVAQTRSLVLVHISVGLAFWGGLILPNLSLAQSGGHTAAAAALAAVLSGALLTLVIGPQQGPRKGRHVPA